jgi:hypothetical protein
MADVTVLNPMYLREGIVITKKWTICEGISPTRFKAISPK